MQIICANSLHHRGASITLSIRQLARGEASESVRLTNASDIVILSGFVVERSSYRRGLSERVSPVASHRVLASRAVMIRPFALGSIGRQVIKVRRDIHAGGAF